MAWLSAHWTVPNSTAGVTNSKPNNGFDFLPFTFYSRNVKQEPIQIRLNLVTSLAIAQAAFLAGIDATEEMVRLVFLSFSFPCVITFRINCRRADS